MSEIKVSEMLEAESVNDEDLIMIIQNGMNKKVPASKVGTGQAGGDSLPIGSIMQYPGDTIPENWLICDGRAISRNYYSELFEKIGTLYGSGDGSTTFNIPNLKGKVAVGKDENDTDFDTLGETGGEKKHTLTVNEMPSHNHKMPIDSFVNSDSQTNTLKGGHVSNQTQGTNYNTTSTGGGQAHNNLQPYIVQNYIIKAKQKPGTATVSEALPIGSEINFEGNSGDIPIGWEEVDDPNEYSSTEKRVGTWINGKPLYQITIYTLDLNTALRVVYQTFSQYGVHNVEFAFLHEAFTRYPGNNYTYPLHGAGCTVQINGPSDQIVLINDNGQGRSQDIYATIRYTKTTD